MSNIDRWREALLKLPDASFFELLRNYLGEIKTPFNKHDLLRQLTAFLNRRDTRDAVFAMIDREDAVLLSAVALLDRPTPRAISLVFEDEKNYVELHMKLVNLAERLLVFRDPDDAAGRIWLNPLFEPDLLDHVIDPELLIKKRESEPTKARRALFSDASIGAFASFFRERPDAIKADGGIKRKAAEYATSRFGFSGADASETAIDLAAKAFKASGALNFTSGEAEIDFERLEVLSRLSEERRAIVLSFRAGGITERLIESAADVAQRAISALSPAGPAAAAGSAAASGPVAGASAAPGQPASAASPAFACDEESLRRLFVLASDDEEIWPLVGSMRDALVSGGVFGLGSDGFLEPAPLSRASAGEKGPPSPVVIQPTFAALAPPGLSYRDGLFLAKAARIVRLGAFAEYEITRDSVVRAFVDGMRGVREGFERLSGTPLPENVAFMLESWYKEYQSIRLDRGIVLTVTDPFRAAVEHAEGMASLLKRTLAPGVYLVDEADEKRLKATLEKAGFACVLPPAHHGAVKPTVVQPSSPGQPEEAGMPPPDAKAAGPTLFPRQEAGTDAVGAPGTVVPPSPLPSAGTSLLATMTPGRFRESEDGPAFRAKLDHELEAMNLTREQVQELQARMDRKLILADDQLRNGAVRSERLEARAMDFAGKVRIIEQALSRGTDALEVVFRGPHGIPERRLLDPSALDRSGGELILAGKAVPSGDDVRLYVSKLSLVRRVRSSLI